MSSRSAPEASSLTPQRLRWVTWLVTGAMFMENLDGSIIATALPQMAASFGTEALRLNVGISAYLLALGVFIPASGWVADRFGARRVFTLAIALFTLTSVLCARASGLQEFVVLRVLQGISGALMVPIGRLVVLRFTPQSRLMLAMSALVWPALIAPVIGPPLGGFITAHAGWRWIFYLNLPLGLVALVLAWLLVPDARQDNPRRFDWAGFVLCGVGTFALLTGLERLALASDGWALGLLALGLASLALAVRHFRRSAQPMLDLSPLAIPTFRATMRGGMVTRMAIGSVPFLLPLMFQVGFGYDPFVSGMLVLVVFIGNLGMKTVTTPILRRFGYRRVLLWNGALCALALAACALIVPGVPLALVVPILLVGGMTRSMQFTCLGTLAFADIPKARMSDANGLFNTLGQVSMAASVTLGALCVHLAQALQLSLPGPGAAYRIAFIAVAAVLALGVLEFVRLPHDAGRDFVAGRGGRS